MPHSSRSHQAIVHSVYLALDSDEPTTLKNAGLYEKQNISFDVYHNSPKSVHPELPGTAWNVAYDLLKSVRCSVSRQTCKAFVFVDNVHQLAVS